MDTDGATPEQSRDSSAPRRNGWISPDDPYATKDENGNTIAVLTVGRVICAWVRQGAYPHVAAAACGVHRTMFDRWLRIAQKRGAKSQAYARFNKQLEQAKAHARVMAEIKVFADDPKTWLRNGPGKEKVDDPGWTSIVKPLLASQTNINMLASPEWNQTWALILRVLKQFPDARAALVEAMQAFEQPKVIEPPKGPQ